LKRLAPKDHQLRKIDKVIDFDFFRGKIKDLCCTDNAHPAVDPAVLFKTHFGRTVHQGGPQEGNSFYWGVFEANQTTLGDISTIISANLDLIE